MKREIKLVEKNGYLLEDGVINVDHMICSNCSSRYHAVKGKLQGDIARLSEAFEALTREKTEIAIKNHEVAKLQKENKKLEAMIAFQQRALEFAALQFAGSNFGKDLPKSWFEDFKEEFFGGEK